MIRLTELRLPLAHREESLRAAIVARLGIADDALAAFTVFRRGHDARKKSMIVAVYRVGGGRAGDPAVLAPRAGDPHVRAAPEMRYRPVAQAPADFAASGRPGPIV